MSHIQNILLTKHVSHNMHKAYMYLYTAWFQELQQEKQNI